jgi:hypothetical protein
MNRCDSVFGDFLGWTNAGEQKQLRRIVTATAEDHFALCLRDSLHAVGEIGNPRRATVLDQDALGQRHDFQG